MSKAFMVPAFPTQTFFNVKTYGAIGNAVADDTTAIQLAITSAQNAGGGTVFFPSGTYMISTTLSITTDNIWLLGASWDSILMPTAGFTASSPMILVHSPSSGYRYGIRIEELFLNVNNVATISGIECDSTYAALLNHVRIRYCTATAIYMSNGGLATGAYNTIQNCHITDGGAGIGVLTNSSEWLRVLGGLISWYSTAGGIAIKIQNLNCEIIGTQFDMNDTSVRLEFASRNVVQGCQFDRGITQFIYLHGAKYNTITGNAINGGTSGGSAIVVSDPGNASNVIANNTTLIGSNWTNWLSENSNTGSPGNLYINNVISSLPVIKYSGIFRHNSGYNPLVQLPAPPAPILATSTTGGTLTAGTYGVQVTYVNGIGETVGSIASSIATTGSTSSITISFPVLNGNATAWYAYVTQVGGATYTRQQGVGNPTAIGSNLVLTSPPTNTGVIPPASNTTGGVITPTLPASGTPYLNTTGVDCDVYVTVGTVTAIAVNGITTGMISGLIRVPVQTTIIITYSVAPTWVWIGE